MVNPLQRKLRLALMGEFSSGKSTLSNLLLGTDPLPTRVTATRLPPVWLSHGTSPARRIDSDGYAHELPGGVLDCISPETTRLVQLQMESEMLELCDLIDLPGISDPNMPRDLWHSVMDEVDVVVWCTHATQAWRQSEAAAWQAAMGKTMGRNLLLVTQIDKLTSERDRSRVMARVRAETEGLFEGHYSISLTDAQAAGEDEEKWAASGAAEFTEHLVDILVSPVSKPAKTPRPPALEMGTSVELSPAPEGADAVLPKRVRNRPGERLRTRPVPLASSETVIRELKLGSGDRP